MGDLSQLLFDASVVLAYFGLHIAYNRSLTRLIRENATPLPPLPALSTGVAPLQPAAPALQQGPLWHAVRRRQWTRRVVLSLFVIATGLLMSRLPFLEDTRVSYDGERLTFGEQATGIDTRWFVCVAFPAVVGLVTAINQLTVSPFRAWLIPALSVGCGVLWLQVVLAGEGASPVLKVVLLIFMTPLLVAITVLGMLLSRAIDRLLRLSAEYAALVWAWVFVSSITLTLIVIGRADTPSIAPGLWQLGAGLAGLVAMLALLPRILAPLVAPAPRLLFLRTFGHTRRTQRTLRRLSRDWLEVGPIHLLSAPDVSRLSLGIAGVFAWLTFRLRKHFVQTPADVDRLLSPRRRRDGRYPLVEVPCLGSAWQAALEHLLGSIDVVVMDLRDFTPENRACVFELEHVFGRFAPERIILLVDDASDLPQLARVLGGRRAQLFFLRDTTAELAAVSSIALAAAGPAPGQRPAA